MMDDAKIRKAMLPAQAKLTAKELRQKAEEFRRFAEALEVMAETLEDCEA